MGYKTAKGISNLGRKTKKKRKMKKSNLPKKREKRNFKGDKKKSNNNVADMRYNPKTGMYEEV